MLLTLCLALRGHVWGLGVVRGMLARVADEAHSLSRGARPRRHPPLERSMVWGSG